jgi:hypothetical protein
LANPRPVPFPQIPDVREVQSAKNEAEGEIQRLRADLSSLQHQRTSVDAAFSSSLVRAESAQGIFEYRNLIIAQSTVESVISANRQKKAESVAASAAPARATFRQLVELPRFKHTIATQQANVLPLFESEFAHRILANEYGEQLAQQYCTRQTKWMHMVDIVTEYSSKTQETLIVWPPEFPAMDAPKVDNALRLRWTAPDQRMFLSTKERRANVYYDMNGLIADPRVEHDEFRARVCWTEEERTIFIEKYKQHQKDFRKIKAALPDKTYKDVIEFYYLNRYPLNLRDSEGTKRRAKKKVISEGVAKRTY